MAIITTISLDELKFYEQSSNNNTFYDYLIEKIFFTFDELANYYYFETLINIKYEWYTQIKNNNCWFILDIKYIIQNYKNLPSLIQPKDKHYYNILNFENFDNNKNSMFILYYLKYFYDNVIKTIDKNTIDINLYNTAIRKLYNYKLYLIQHDINNNLKLELEELRDNNLTNLIKFQEDINKDLLTIISGHEDIVDNLIIDIENIKSFHKEILSKLNIQGTIIIKQTDKIRTLQITNNEILLRLNYYDNMIITLKRYFNYIIILFIVIILI